MPCFGEKTKRSHSTSQVNACTFHGDVSTIVKWFHREYASEGKKNSIAVVEPTFIAPVPEPKKVSCFRFYQDSSKIY